MANISIHIGSKDDSWFRVERVTPRESALLVIETTYNLPRGYEGGGPHCFDRSTLVIHADDIEDLRQLARDIMDALPPEEPDASEVEG